MLAAENNRPSRIVQSPPLPPNPKTLSNYSSPREPYLTRTNSNSKQRLNKISAEKSVQQKKFEQEIKYALPTKIQATLQRSSLQIQNGHGPILVNTPLQETLAALNQTKTYSRSKIRDRDESKERGSSAKPFDVLSSATAHNQEKNRDANNQYYLYWKNKAHQYLQSNMKLMEDVRKLTRQNQLLKQRIQFIESSSKSTLKPQIKNPEIANQAIKKEQCKQNSYLIQKMDQIQRQLKKKDIMIKSYQEKIMQLNSKVAGDNERTRLISKLKLEVEGLRSQLYSQITVSKRQYVLPTTSSIQERHLSIERRQESKFSNVQKR